MKFDLSIPPIITVVLLVLMGKWDLALVFGAVIGAGIGLKQFILNKVKESISSIAQKLPKTASISVEGRSKEVAIKDIRVGDILTVKSGDRLATDAFLDSPQALIDESVVTGESVAILKHKGDKILAGSINQGDYFEAKATSTSDKSTLQEIQNMVFSAQNSKAPLAEVVSKYALFTSAFALAGVLFIFFITKNILTALSFWIAVVPVIFAIIVPVATIIAISVLSRRGLLVKNNPALEALGKSEVFLFDKTGTITLGTPEVSNITVTGNLSDNEVLKLAAGLDKYSNHPLAKALTAEAQKRHIGLPDFDEVKTVAGKGIEGIYGKIKVVVGNKFLFEELGIKVSMDYPDTAILVAADGIEVGVILTVDRLRDNAKEILELLSSQGVEVGIITGDKKEIAEKLLKGIPGIFIEAEVSPSQKLDIVGKYLEQRKTVIMVGDGINDAPALAKANVGIAMGRGTDITLNAADIVILNNDLRGILVARSVAVQTFKIIKEDVILATLIHIITAIFALTGSINLIWVVIIHEISSLLVIINTLRLFRPSFGFGDNNPDNRDPRTKVG